ncbi:MAG: hypothetical protein EBU84_20495 [Actinobacteria bacterium]|nr:hypothetical protein [Actinomycetota bacterium]
METKKGTYKVYISDTISGSSDVRYYKTRSAAERRFDKLNREFRRNGHNYILMVETETTMVIRSA